MTRPATSFPDPLGVRAACDRVMRETPWVRIDAEAVERVAGVMAPGWGEPPAWDDTLHFRGSPREIAGWVVVLDALNFCFWAQGDDPGHRWRVTWRGTTHDGYDALAAALHRAVVDDGHPIWDLAWLRALTPDTLDHVLRGDEGCPGIPLPEERLASLRDLAHPTDIPDRAPADLVDDAGSSVAAVARIAVRRYPCFEDVATWRSISGDVFPVPLYKRAQILAADLAGALGGTPLAPDRDREALTAFADYKVPQVLRRLGILIYHHDLADGLRQRDRLAVNSPEEVSIRAATVRACDDLVRTLAAYGVATTASELDWRLWTLGQRRLGDAEPYHRTVTTAY